MVCLITLCSVPAAQGVFKTESPIDIEVASQKINFSFATTGHHSFFNCAKDQTRHPEYPDDMPGILPDLGERVSVNEFYLLTPASRAYYTWHVIRPIRAPPCLLS